MNRKPGDNLAIAVILAGGRSSRMGRDKALLPLNGIPLIQHVQAALSSIFEEIVVVGRSPDALPIPNLHCLPDYDSGLGPIGGLLTALRYAQGRSVFLVGCDMPYLNPDVIHLMLARVQGFDAAVPMVGGWMQPLHAAYNGTCLPVVERQVENRVLSMHQLIQELRVQIIAEDELRLLDSGLKSVQGLNSPEEYDRAVQLASDAQP